MDLNYNTFEKLIRDQFDPQFNFDYQRPASWSSMQSLIVVSTIDEHYNILISHEELKQTETLEALHNKVIQKTA